jgi:hypothetical protein
MGALLTYWIPDDDDDDDDDHWAGLQNVSFVQTLDMADSLRRHQI